MSDTDDYSDIIHLPHHQSARHPHMTMRERAAQFGSFAAVRGHAEAIGEVESGQGRIV